MPFQAVIEAEGANTSETVTVTASDKDVLTISRASSGSVASAHGAGAVLRAAPTSLDRGLAFPTDALDGDSFYRTDLNRLFFRDSAQSAWVSDVFALSVNIPTTVFSATTPGAGALGCPVALGLVLDSLSIVTNVAGTNDASNCWVISANTIPNGSSVATEILTVSTGSAPDAPAKYINHEGVASPILISAGTSLRMDIKTKTGAPGNITLASVVAHVRIVLS